MTEDTDYDVMVFDTYSPRDDADARNYDDWLAKVDSPLFNSLDMVAGYTCWKVVDAKGNRAPRGRGETEPFTHFGFFGLRDEAGFGAMMADPKAEAHVPVWVSEWSRYPDTEDMAMNFFFSFARRRASSEGSRTATALLVPFESETKSGVPGYTAWAERPEIVKDLTRMCRYESWIVEQRLQGDYGPNGLDIFYLDDAAQAEPVWQSAPDAVLGALIAGP